MRPAVSRRRGGGCRSFGIIGQPFRPAWRLPLLFLLFKASMTFVDGSLRSFSGNLAKPLQAVLQFDGRQMGFQFGQDT